ncbi:MAG: polysaccharide deacetylase family protein [Alphaproteobacteria bacterium]
MNEDAAWARLEAELDAWRAEGRAATLWWRDDDAGAASPALLRLLALAKTHRVPLALATVPAWATAELAAAATDEFISVVQHGYAHANYAPEGQKKFELGPERPAAIVVAELAQGWQRLEQLFGARFWPALVPPWNRMAGYLPPYLAELRYRGLSQFGPRARREPVRGLVQVNTHVDIVHWKSAPPRFAGAAKLIGEFAEHLAARRTRAVDAAEPTGLLTHHAAHDAACWQFLEGLFARLARHAAVRWLPAARVFADAPAP